MVDLLQNIYMEQTDFLKESGRVLVGILVSAFGLCITLAVAAAFFDELIAPLRLKERTRLFLELIETAFRQGRSVEHTIISLSEMREKSLGVHFHLLAAHLQNGLTLGAALEATPAFVSREVQAMLKAGEEIGDVRKVLPACRFAMDQGTSQSQTAQNTSVLVFMVAPFGPMVLGVLTAFVFPKLKDIALDFLGVVPPGVEMLFSASTSLALLVTVLWCLILVFGMGHKGGTGLFARLWARLWPVTDRLNYRLPWRRRRMQRDFSAMLAILLDAEVPEARAVQLAAKSTANRIFMARSQRVVADLQQGMKLTEAVHWLDNHGEFQWRLRNASLPQGEFRAALAGWHEALEAKAFQQEQSFSQAVTTGFVFLNGLMVALTAIGVFMILIAITEEAPLW